MPRYSMLVAYDGTDFHGWQKQAGLRTVQEELEQAVQKVVHQSCNVVGAGRTDAGVHALGQVGVFSADAEFEPSKLAAAVNARLPPDIRVRRPTVVPEGFNPISDAIAKGYRYRVRFGSDDRAPMRPLFGRRTNFWTPHALDPVTMNLAARRLIGTHDFASFTRKHHDRESTVRTIYDCTVTRTGRRRLRLDVCGDGFLHNMVRIVAGTLLEVGRGRVKPEQIEQVIAARDRTAAGPTLPPEGLFLMWVKYP